MVRPRMTGHTGREVRPILLMPTLPTRCPAAHTPACTSPRPELTCPSSPVPAWGTKISYLCRDRPV